MKYLGIFLTAIFLLALTNGCNKLDLQPTDRFTDNNFWTSSGNVNNALNDLYNQVLDDNADNREMNFFRPEALSDNAVASDPTIVTGGFTSSALVFGTIWRYNYQGINACNRFIDNVDKNKTLAPEVIARMKGEARFLRSWFYVTLINWWGDVPLITSTITPEEAKLISRAPKKAVVDFITSELDAATSVLPTTAQYATADKGRITKGAALALKARVLLNERDRMAEVVEICEKLMKEQSTYGNYSLQANYSDLFSHPTINKNSDEVMFAYQFVPLLRTWWQGNRFFPPSVGSATSELAPTQELVDSYIMKNGKFITEAGSGYDEKNPYADRDPRLNATVVYDKYVWRNPDGTTQVIHIKPGTDPDPRKLNEYNPASARSLTGFYWRKYFDPNHTAGMVSGLNQILIRYAEILMNYAEAKHSLQQMNATVWDATIKPLRQRAGFTNPDALNYPGNQANMTNIIRNERRAEFAMEALRVNDIRRWRISENVLNGFAHGAQFGDPKVDNGFLRIQQRQFDPSRHYLWPVPESEMNLAPNLTQNPGYN